MYFCFESGFSIKGLSCCIESVLLYRSRVIPGVLLRISLFSFVCSYVLTLSLCFELGLLYRSRVIPGVLLRISLFCFVFVLLFSFESVSAGEPVVTIDLYKTAVIFTLLWLPRPCANCTRKFE